MCTIADAAIAAGAGRMRRNAGISKVPNPKPQKKLRKEPHSAAPIKMIIAVSKELFIAEVTR